MPGLAAVAAPNPPNAASDLPTADYPAAQRIVATDRVGTAAANRQPKSLEKRTVTLASVLKAAVDQLNKVDEYYLRRDGTVQAGNAPASGMTGDLPLNGHKVTGVGDGVSPQDAVSKAQLDGKVSKTGDTMSGPLVVDAETTLNGDVLIDGVLDLGENPALSSVNPNLLSGDAATRCLTPKSYVDALLAGSLLSAGGRLCFDNSSPWKDGNGATLRYARHAHKYCSTLDSSAAAIVPTTIPEAGLTVGSFSAGKVYDIFAWYTGGALALVKVEWASVNSRGYALTHAPVGGFLVKSGTTDDLRKRYLGTVYADTGGVVYDEPENRCVCNADNQLAKNIRVFKTSTLTWAYNTASWRKWNGEANGMRFRCVYGLDYGGWLDLHLSQQFYTITVSGSGPASNRASIAIGNAAASVDADCVVSTAGNYANEDLTATLFSTMVSRLNKAISAAGFYEFHGLEYADGTNGCGFGNVYPSMNLKNGFLGVAHV